MDVKTLLILVCCIALRYADTMAYTPQMVLFSDTGIRKLSFDNLAGKLNKENFSTPSFSYFIGASAYFLAKKMIFGLTSKNVFRSKEAPC